MKTPIIELFKRANFEKPSHFNQSIVLRSNSRVNKYALLSTIRVLCVYHDMLRAYWANGQICLKNSCSPDLFHFEEHDLRMTHNYLESFNAICNHNQESIELTTGPLIHIVLFRMTEFDAVFLVIHHLIIDGVSWRILVEDMNSTYSQVLLGKASIQLPKQLGSYSQYSDYLEHLPESELKKDLSFWRNVSVAVNKIQSVNKIGIKTESKVPFIIDKDITKKLLTAFTGNNEISPNAVLLGSLARAWKKTTGETMLSVLMESHHIMKE